MRLAATLACLLAASPALATEVPLQNDKFSMMGELTVPGNFAANEGIGESFTAPANYYPFKIVGVQFMAVGAGGADSGKADLTFTVYKDVGTAAPGLELVKQTTKDVEGSLMFVQEDRFDATPTVDSGAVRLVVTSNAATVPNGLTFLIDKSASPAKHSTICAQPQAGKPCVWSYSDTLGIKGTWVLRLIVDTMNDVPVPDGGGGGTRPDGGTSGGAPTVDSITPDTVPEGSGGSAVILGEGFIAGNPHSGVFLDGPKGPSSIANVLVMDARTIKISIPEGLAQGEYDVVVQNPNGASGKLRHGLTVSSGDAKSGCSLGQGPQLGDLGLLLLGGLLLLPGLRRRRHRH